LIEAGGRGNLAAGFLLRRFRVFPANHLHSAAAMKMARRVIVPLYTASGAAALVYEVVWTRMLALHLGHTVAAASTVLAAFMGGPHLTVYGNAQDGVGNTMNGGQVIIHGSVGDVMGYAMRGGTILVRGSVGYRAGIHMKSFKRQVPCIVVGGSAGDFLGEYMAGGTLVVLGLDQPGPPVGRWVATGMHGGAIYVRGELPADRTGSEVTAAPAGADDEPVLFPLLEEFAAAFDLSAAELKALSFTRLAPVSHRPYGNHYAG
jgi:glutamate synthase domain-containing protein 3